MDYEIVTLNKKYISGFGVRTSNTSADMEEKIGNLWQRFFSWQISERIQAQIGQASYGVYTNYESDFAGDYDIIAGVETRAEENSKGIQTVVIPSGRYAKFTVKGTMDEVKAQCAQIWQYIWSQDFDRAYGADFEEYLTDEKEGNHQLNLYIGLKN